MKWAKTIQERRSIRRFKASPEVDQQLVRELLREAQGLYPSGGTAANYRCVYAGTADSRARLAASMLEPLMQNKLVKWLPEKVRDFVRKRVTEIPGHLAVIASADEDKRKGDMNIAAVCGIMQNFQLLAWQRQLGVLWDTEPMMQNPGVISSVSNETHGETDRHFSPRVFRQNTKRQSQNPCVKRNGPS